VAFLFLYLAFRALLGAVVRSRRGLDVKDLELLVLRHEERFVRTVRAECLDWLMIVNRRHLDRVLRVFIEHYKVHRPHRALKLRPPQPREPPPVPTTRAIDRRDRLGGLIHEYYRTAG
jgi:hypothetical protein